LQGICDGNSELKNKRVTLLLLVQQGMGKEGL
jgi:hypothetical protein